MNAISKFDGEHSVAFCEQVFSKVKGRASVRIGGKIACYDRTRKEVFINDIESDKTAWMPAKAFLEHLPEADFEILDALPDWDGGNEYILSAAVLSAVESAIKNYRM